MSSTVGRVSQKQTSAALDGEQTADCVPCSDVLRRTPLFAGLSDDHLKVLAPPCRHLNVYRGTVLFTKGDQARELYVVLDGEVCLEEEISVGGSAPDRTLTVERVGKNGVLGMCALIKPYQSRFTGRCTKDASLIAISSQDLRALMKANSSIGLIVLENAFHLVYERLTNSHHRIVAEVGTVAMYSAHRNY